MNFKKFVESKLKKAPAYTLEIQFIQKDFQKQRLKNIPKKEIMKRFDEIEDMVVHNLFSNNSMPFKNEIKMGKKTKIKVYCFSNNIENVVKDLQNAFMEKFKCPFVNIKVKEGMKL